MSIDYRIGDTRDLTRALPDGSVHLVATSPPFLALRSYLPADHEHKHAEIGNEPDPATFLDTLLALTAEWGRVLAPWGSIAIELGDTYSGGSAEGSDTRSPESQRFRGWADGDLRSKNGTGWPRVKSLALIPQLYATSLAYGRNLLTGAPSPAGQWLVRNVVVWHRPNPAVGALGDKYRPSTSYIVVATRSPKRWFDLTAVRTPGPPPAPSNRGATEFERAPDLGKARNGTIGMDRHSAGAPPLDCWFDHDDHDTWTITPQPSRLAHYAMWPAKLAERLILSMCPAEVCATCGEPRRRMEGKSARYAEARAAVGDFRSAHDRSGGLNGTTQYHDGLHIVAAENVTLGWTDCGHDNYAPGVTLDPFAGTGTTLAVADIHGRHGIGFDLDVRNAALVDARYAEVAKNLAAKPSTGGKQLAATQEALARAEARCVTAKTHAATLHQRLVRLAGGD